MIKQFLGIFILSCFLAGGSLYGQNGINPFDLSPRLPEKPAPGTTADSAEAAGPKNPFDIVREETQTSTPAFTPIVEREESPLLEEVQEAGEGVDSSYRRFLFTVVMIDLLLLTLLFTLFRSVVVICYRAFLNDNMLTQVHRDEGAFASLPFQLFYLFFFLNAGFFIYLLIRHFGGFPGNTYWQDLGILVAGVAAVFFFKHLLLKIVQGVFALGKEIRLYSFTIIIFSIILGLVLLPLNLLIAYGPENLVEGSVYLALGFVGLTYLFRVFRSLFLATQYLAFHKFHFLLYICTVELVPVLILIKLVFLVTENGVIG